MLWLGVFTIVLNVEADEVTGVWKALEIAALIVAPLAWGLLVDFVFERLRRRRSARGGEGEGAA